MARAQSLALRGQLSYPQLYGNDRVRSLSTSATASASPDVSLEPGQAWLGALLYRLAMVLGVGGAQTALTLNIIATALTGVLIYITIGVLGFSSSTAIASALVYGTATMAWPYAGTFFRDPLAATMTTLAFLGWALVLRGADRDWLAGSLLIGVGVVAGALFKGTTLVVLPAMIAGLCAHGLARGHRLLARVRLALVVVLAFPFAVAALIPPVGPLARLSLRHWVSAAQAALSRASLGLIPATLGPLVSPAKSIFLFSPVLALAPFALGAWARPKRAFAIAGVAFVLLLCVAQALVLGDLWAGTLIWGLRFMLPAIPILVILSAPLIEAWLGLNSKWLKLAGGVLGVSSIGIQVAGAIVPWSIPFLVWAAQGKDPYSAQAVWSPQYLSIPIHLARMGMAESWDLGWIRSWDSSPAWLIPMGSLLILILVFLLLRRKISAWAAPGIVLAALVFPFDPMLGVLRPDPAWGGDRPELAEIATRVADAAQADDLILVDSYGSPLWRFMLNRWSSPVEWHSLPAGGWRPLGERALPPEVRQLIVQAVQEQRAVWLLCSSPMQGNECGPAGTEVKRLLGLGLIESFEGTGSATLFMFDTRRAARTVR